MGEVIDAMAQLAENAATLTAQAVAEFPPSIALITTMTLLILMPPFETPLESLCISGMTCTSSSSKEDSLVVVELHSLGEVRQLRVGQTVVAATSAQLWRGLVQLDRGTLVLCFFFCFNSYILRF